MMQQNTSFKKIVKTLGAQWDEFLTKVVALFSYTVRFQDKKETPNHCYRNIITYK